MSKKIDKPKKVHGIAHIFAAIITTINPQYEYVNEDGQKYVLSLYLLYTGWAFHNLRKERTLLQDFYDNCITLFFVLP